MSDSGGLAKLVPGFDFLQNLAKSAGSAIPGVGQWIAPTLDPKEIEKRIDELKTVQFWLEQNARMLATTIQALEVQRMTLSTLKTMNVQLGDLRSALPGTPKAAAADKPAAKSPAGVVDPMQWWSALTNQFTQIATTAMKDGAADAAKAMASSVLRQSASLPGKVASAAGRAAAGAASQALVPRKPPPRKRAPAKRRNTSPNAG